MADTSPARSVPLPRGFTSHTTNLGIKDATTDFVVVAADERCSSAGAQSK